MPGTPNHRIDPPVGGYAVGIAASAGYTYSPTAAVEGEIALAGVVGTDQVFSYDWREEYRTQQVDRFFSVLGRWMPAGDLLSLVAGGGFTATTLTQREGLRTQPYKPWLPAGPTLEQRHSYVALALTGGVDARVPLTARITLVPTARARWVNRPKGGLSSYAGAGAFVLQGGLGVQVGF